MKLHFFFSSPTAAYLIKTGFFQSCRHTHTHTQIMLQIWPKKERRKQFPRHQTCPKILSKPFSPVVISCFTGGKKKSCLTLILFDATKDPQLTSCRPQLGAQTSVMEELFFSPETITMLQSEKLSQQKTFTTKNGSFETLITPLLDTWNYKSLNLAKKRTTKTISTSKNNFPPNSFTTFFLLLSFIT